MKDYYLLVENLVKSNKRSYSNILRHKYPEVCQFLYEKYPKLSGHLLPEYCYWFLNNLTDFPKCANPNCTNKVEFLNISLGYRQYCSRLCMQTDPLTEQKRIKTNLRNYGVTHTQVLESVKQKSLITRKQHAAEDPNYIIKINTKIKKTREKHKKENPNFLNEILEKRMQTNISNGHDPFWNNKEKTKQTKKQHADEDPQYIEKIVQKRRNTRKQHADEDPNYNEKINAKIKKTRIKHQEDNPNYWLDITNKTKTTKQIRYNDPYFRNSKKAKKTSKIKFGVESYSQTTEFHSRRSKKYKSDKYKMTFDSKWEYLVYDFCITNNIEIEYQPNIKFEYIVKNEKHIYIPDFKINGKLYEVKGDHFFKDDGTMFCPFRNKNWTDKQYQNICDQYEAKHQCMLRNGITILRNNDIQNLRKIFL